MRQINILFMFFDLINQMVSSPIEQRLVIAATLGALVGLEREIAGKDPSLRTFTLICLGSCMFSLISIEAASQAKGQFADPGRISAQVVSGIGFLGAGAIFRSKGGVSGLTTAALMWVTAAIGMSVGYGLIELAVSGTLIGILVTFSLKLVHTIIRRVRPHMYEDQEDYD